MKVLVDDVSKFLEVVPDAELKPIYTLYKGGYVKVGDYYAIVRKGTPTVYSVVGSKYVLVQHREVIEAVEKALADYGIEPTMRIARFDKPSMKTLYYDVVYEENKIDGDRMTFGIRVRMSYDGSSSISINGMGVRSICSNLMVFGRELMSEYVIHVGEPLEKLLKKALPKVLDGLQFVRDIINAAMKQMISPKEFHEFVDKLAPSERLKRSILKFVRDEVGETFTKLMHDQTPITIWQAYNAITRALTHDRGKLSEDSVTELHKKASKLLLAAVSDSS